MPCFRPGTTYRYTGQSQFLNTTLSMAPPKSYARQMAYTALQVWYTGHIGTYSYLSAVFVLPIIIIKHNILPEHRYSLTLYSTRYTIVWLWILIKHTHECHDVLSHACSCVKHCVIIISIYYLPTCQPWLCVV